MTDQTHLTREDILRRDALQMAQNSMATAKEIVERAEAFYAFLVNEGKK